MGTAAAVAILIRKEKEMVAAFRDRRATSADSAVALDSLNLHEGAAFRVLRRHAVLRPASSNTWYLDEPSWEALRTFRRRMRFVVLTIIAVVFVIGLLTAKMVL